MAKSTNDQTAPTVESLAETFIPSVTFEGYPDGVHKVVFYAGVESIPVSPEYAALIRAKNLASDK